MAPFDFGFKEDLKEDLTEIVGRINKKEETKPKDLNVKEDLSEIIELGAPEFLDWFNEARDRKGKFPLSILELLFILVVQSKQIRYSSRALNKNWKGESEIEEPGIENTSEKDSIDDYRRRFIEKLLGKKIEELPKEELFNKDLVAISDKQLLILLLILSKNIERGK